MLASNTPLGAWRAVLARDTGRTGTLGDLERAWLARQGVTGGTLAGMWRSYAASKGYAGNEDGLRGFAESGLVSAITASHLVTTGTSTDASSFNTASITPTANRLVLAWIVGATSPTPPASPTLTGNGLTWVAVDTIVSSTRRLTLYRAMGSSPSAGAMTIDFGGETVGGCAWSIAEFSGIDTSGTNGSGAIVQAPTSTTSSTTTHTATLSAFSNSRNAAAAGILHGNNETLTITNATLLGTRNQGGPNFGLATGFKAAALTGVIATWATTGTGIGIAVEIKAV